MVLETAGRVSEEAKVEASEPQPLSAEATETAPPPAEETPGSSFPDLLALARKVLPPAWILAGVAAGVLSGAPLFFLVLAAGALTLVVTMLWASVQSLTGGASIGFEEALGMGAPSKVEEEKRAVLRALKDLEYERGVGKISPEDYAELSAKYRAEAKRLMQTLDDKLGPARAEVESDIEKRLARAGLPAIVVKKPEATPEPSRPVPDAAGAKEEEP